VSLLRGRVGKAKMRSAYLQSQKTGVGGWAYGCLDRPVPGGKTREKIGIESRYVSEVSSREKGGVIERSRAGRNNGSFLLHSSS